jgi:outer membrane protein TolC
MRSNSWWTACAQMASLAVFLFLLPASLLAEPVTLKQAIELALKHGTSTAISADDEQHAFASYRELRNSYIPQVTAGAGLGYSYGFPLSLEGAAPSLFNVNAQSALYHPELREFTKAAQANSASAALRSKDQRNQTIEDTVLSYAELAKWEQRLARLRGAVEDADKMQAAVSARVKEGIDSPVDQTKARLSVARLRLRIAEADGAAEVLRQRMSKLTGLAAAAIQTDPASLPQIADGAAADDQEKSAAANPAVQAAFKHAEAESFRALAEHRSLLPSVDFAAQYALLSTYNNYDTFYKSFQRNNATIGVSIRLPIFNFSQRARAQADDADADKARRQAVAARDKMSEETLRLQKSVEQMRAARDVAELEYELAEKNVEAVRTRVDSGAANLHDLDEASGQANERFISLQDVTFELERSQVNLLRATGGLADWALGHP